MTITEKYSKDVLQAFRNFLIGKDVQNLLLHLQEVELNVILDYVEVENSKGLKMDLMFQNRFNCPSISIKDICNVSDEYSIDMFAQYIQEIVDRDYLKLSLNLK